MAPPPATAQPEQIDAGNGEIYNVVEEVSLINEAGEIYQTKRERWTPLGETREWTVGEDINHCRQIAESRGKRLAKVIPIEKVYDTLKPPEGDTGHGIFRYVCVFED